MDRKPIASEKDRDAKRRLRFHNFWFPTAKKLISNIFNFSHEEFEAADIEGPVIVAINHASAYDPIFVGLAFKNKILTKYETTILYLAGSGAVCHYRVQAPQ